MTLLRNVSGVIKTSTVLIAEGRNCDVYRSVQEVPEPLRSKLIHTTAGGNSGTIVIADRAGKEQLTRVMARREGQAAVMPAQAIPALPEETSEPAMAEEIPADGTYRVFGVSWMAWAGLLAVLTAGAVTATLFGVRW